MLITQCIYAINVLQEPTAASAPQWCYFTRAGHAARSDVESNGAVQRRHCNCEASSATGDSRNVETQLSLFIEFVIVCSNRH